MNNLERASALYRESVKQRNLARPLLFKSLSDSAPLIRHIAAIVLAQLSPEDLPEESIRELLETLAKLEYLEHLVLDDEYTSIVSNEDDYRNLGEDIVLAFKCLRCGQANFVAFRLLEFWSFDIQFYELGHALISLSFFPSDSPIPADSLTGLQQRVLQATIRQNDIWSGDMFWPTTLTTHGLPNNHVAMRQFLGYRW